MMLKTPRILVEAFGGPQDAEMSLGMVDITYAIVQDMNPHGQHVRDPQFPPKVMTLSPCLNDEQRQHGVDGNLSIPGLRAAIDAWLLEIGGHDGVLPFKRHLDELSQANWRLRRATELRKEVEGAVLATGEGMEMFFTVGGRHDYVSELDEANQGYAWDLYVAEHPRPDLDWESPGYKQWEASYAAWVRATAAPFVFGTSAEDWGGIDEARVREEFEANGAADVEGMIESDLMNVEDGEDRVVDVEGVLGIVERWEAHAGSGDEEDLGLGKLLTAWNAKQNLRWYWKEPGIVVPLYEGVGLDEIKGWCERNVAAAEAQVAGIENGWSQPVATAANAF